MREKTLRMELRTCHMLRSRWTTTLKQRFFRRRYFDLTDYHGLVSHHNVFWSLTSGNLQNILARLHLLGMHLQFHGLLQFYLSSSQPISSWSCETTDMGLVHYVMCLSNLFLRQLNWYWLCRPTEGWPGWVQWVMLCVWYSDWYCCAWSIFVNMTREHGKLLCTIHCMYLCWFEIAGRFGC